MRDDRPPCPHRGSVASSPERIKALKVARRAQRQRCFVCISTIAGGEGQGKRHASARRSQALSAAAGFVDRYAPLPAPPASPDRIALAAIEHVPDPALAPFGRRHPGALDPRRVVPDVLGMAAFQVGHPVSLFILVQGDDGTIQMTPSWSACPEFSSLTHVICHYTCPNPWISRGDTFRLTPLGLAPYTAGRCDKPGAMYRRDSGAGHGGSGRDRPGGVIE
jgi:hypothetical protein